MIRSVPMDLVVFVQELDRQSDLQARRFLHRNVDVELEAGVVLDGRQRGRTGDAIARAHRNITHGACERRRHARIGPLVALLLDLFLDRFQLGLGRSLERLRLIVLLLAHGADFEQLPGTLGLLAGEGRVGFPRGAEGLETRDRSRLRRRVDLEQDRAGRDPVPRLHVDLGDEAFHLRLHGDRSS